MLRQKSVSDIPDLDPQQDPEVTAKAAGLRYVMDSSPGFSRRKKGKNFVYFDTQGKVLKNQNHLARIQSLVIPPAWEQVWICPFENGHLQATGKDQKNRKQYRYHAEWNRIRNETKFSKMLLFAEKLPLIRSKVEKDLQLPGMGREKVLASIVKIMETTMVRIGNDEYAEKNESFGLTTIRNRHAEVRGKKIRFRFKGKSGKMHDVEIEDPKLAKIIQRCQDLPGQELFGYEDEQGNFVDISSSDVNDYLKEITGEHITAKDFRTWGGTVEAAQALQKIGPHQTKKELKKQILKAVQQTAESLRNTPTVCRKYYIHPCVFEAYENGRLFKVHASCQRTKAVRKNGLYPNEIFAVKLLEQAIR